MSTEELMKKFIENKGLWNEFNEFKQAELDAMNGYCIEFDIMLGDADGHYRQEILITKQVLENFKKYFNEHIKQLPKFIYEVCDISHEFIPGASIYSDQLLALFNEISDGILTNSIRTTNEYSLANFRYTVEKENVADWVISEYFEEEPERLSYVADDLQEMFEDMYFRYVLPYINNDIFIAIDSFGQYSLYATN